MESQSVAFFPAVVPPDTMIRCCCTMHDFLHHHTSQQTVQSWKHLSRDCFVARFRLFSLLTGPVGHANGARAALKSRRALVYKASIYLRYVRIEHLDVFRTVLPKRSTFSDLFTLFSPPIGAGGLPEPCSSGTESVRTWFRLLSS